MLRGTVGIIHVSSCRSHKWWLQSTLSGIDRIVVGHRNSSGVVVQVRYIFIREKGVFFQLRNMDTKKLSSNRMTDVIMTFLSAVLSEIERRLEKDGNLQVGYISCSQHNYTFQIRYDPKGKKVHFESAREQETNILIDEFHKLL